MSGKEWSQNKAGPVASALVAVAYAKVNLFLEVCRKRGDGYHDIISVFQEIDLADRLEVEATDDDALAMWCSDPALPIDSRNLVLKAAARLREAAGIRRGAFFRLWKNIPIGAGLGGGSSDAAAGLRLAAALWGLNLRHEDLACIAAEVSSDAPFFFWGGICLCEGKGERVTPLPYRGLDICLVLPPWSISTHQAYSVLTLTDGGRRDPRPMIEALARGDNEAAAAASFNRLEETAFAIEPRQRRLQEALRAAGGRPARLSGSGSACWLLDDNKGNLDELAAIARLTAGAQTLQVRATRERFLA